MAIASAQDVGKRMNNPRRVAPIGDLRSKPVGDPEAPLRQSQQHRAAVGTDAATIERGGFDPAGYPAKPLVSYQVLPTTSWVDPSSTGEPRRWGALRHPG
jgi:hypothetical protein